MSDFSAINASMGRYQPAPGNDTILASMGNGQPVSVTPPPLTLNALTAAVSEITQGKSEGAIQLSGVTNGSTLSSTSLRGLALSGTSLSGTATSAGTIAVVETLTGATNSPRSSTVITVNPPVTVSVSIPTSLTQGTAITPFTATATGGTGAKTWSLSGFAAGISINASGQVSGTPSASGSFANARVIATDTRGATGEVSASITVAGSGPTPLYAPNLTRAAAGQTVALVGNDGWKRQVSDLAPNAPANLAVNEFGKVVQVANNNEGEANKVAIMHEFATGDGYTVAFNVTRPPTGQRGTLLMASTTTNGFNYRGISFMTKADGGWVLSLPDVIQLEDTSAEANLLPDGQDVHLYHNVTAKTLEIIIAGGKSFGPYDVSQLHPVGGAPAGNVGFAAGGVAGFQPIGAVLGFPPKVWPGRHLGGSGQGNPSDVVFSTAPSISRQGGGTTYNVGDTINISSGGVDPATGTLVDSELRRGTNVIAVAPLPSTYVLQPADAGRALRIVSTGQNAVGKLKQASSNTALIAGTGTPVPQRILGMGIQGPESYSSTRPYENLFLSGRWVGKVSSAVSHELTEANHSFNAEGFPTTMTMKDGTVLIEISRQIQNVVKPGEPMRVAWTGDVDCSLYLGNGQVRSGNRIDYTHSQPLGMDPYGAFLITAIRTPLTALDCRETSKADNASATVRNRVFNPAFVTEQSKYAILRAMDLLVTNSNVREETWISRATNRWRTTLAGAMPWEDVVALANLTKCDLWINVPWWTFASNNAYVRTLATYLRDNLNSNLKIYIEIANEVWNSQFRIQGLIARWSKYGNPDSVGLANPGQPLPNRPDGSSRANEPSSITFDDVCRGYARRMLEVFTVFGEVFNGAMSRIVRVAGSSPLNIFIPIRAREFFNSWRVISEYNVLPLVDAVCVGAYFGYGVNPVGVRDKPVSEGGTGLILPGTGADHPDWSSDMSVLFQRTESEINQLIDLALNEQAWFATHGKPMIVYEGFQSHADWIYDFSGFWNLPTDNPPGQGDRVRPVFREYQKHGRMADMFELFGTRWINEVQAPICGFVDKGMLLQDNHGPFGTGYNDFDSTDPASPSYAPKRAGMEKVLALNPRQEVGA